MRYFIITLITLLNIVSSHAEVVGSDKHGFELKIEREVNVSRSIAYQQFLNVGQWWSPDHTWFGKAKNLSITPEVGGCFCEISNQKQAMHMTVSFVNPDNEIKMIGGLGPLQMMGINGGMSWKFTSLDDKRSLITFHYQVSGYISGGLNKLAPIVDQVQSLQLNRLASLLNTGTP